MRIWISALLLASTAALGAPAVAQDGPPRGHDGGGHDGGGQHGGDRGDRGGQPQNRPQPQPQNQAPQQNQQRPPQGMPNGARPNEGRPDRGPQGGGGDPRANGNPGFQGGHGRGDDPRWRGQAGGDPANRPGWGNRPGGDRGPGGDGRPGGYGRPGGNDGHAHDRPVFQDGRPGFDDRGNDNRGGYGRGPGDGGRPGYDRANGGRPGYDRDRGDRGGGWNRGWRNDNRYDWQGYRNQHRDIYRGRGYRAPNGYGYGYRRFGVGVTIESAFFAQQYWIGNPGYYRLPPAYGLYRWVRYYNDALLVDIYSGLVVDSIPGFFW